MARGEVISLTGRPFPNSSNDIAECGIPELLLRGLLAFAGFAVFQIDFGDISFLIVELGPNDRFAGFQRLGHIEDALVSGAGEPVMASQIGVNPNTVAKAYQDMCSRSTTRYLWYDRIPGGYVVRAAPAREC